jgi:CRP/FNR family transcriptional regulator, cyclic AMP receptor protein
MVRMSRGYAERIMCQSGWLAQMPETFRTQLLQNALLLKYETGQAIFRPGDPPGGIYGHVAGTVVVNTAPLDSTPRLIHIAVPGGWTGEDCFMTGQPRRIELCAQSEVWAMHVPLETMEQMAASDPNNIRAFGVISIMSSDKLLRIVHDLQKKNVSARIASVLHRMSWATDVAISVSQENLGVMTNTSRKQVNSAIQRFVEAGWVEIGYRSITVTNPSALRRYAEEDVEN